jgi:hypothetical protein
MKFHTAEQEMNFCYLPRRRTVRTRLRQVSDDLDGNHGLKLRAHRRRIASGHRKRIVGWIYDANEARIATTHHAHEQRDRDQGHPNTKSARER